MIITEYGCTVVSDGKQIMILTDYEPDRARMADKVEHALTLMLIKMERENA